MTWHIRACLAMTLACALGLTGRGSAQAPAGSTAPRIETVAIRPNIHLIAGGGGNVVVQIGSDGVIAIDSGAPGRTDPILAAIRQLTDKPVRYIINTNADADHVGGNAAMAQAGRTIFQVGNALGTAMTNNGAAGIIAYERVLFRMSGRAGGTPTFPTAAWPTDTHAQSRRALYLNDEGVEFLHQPAAHSDADMAVFFRRSDVVVAGDVIDATRFPAIDVDNGGTIDGEVAALNRLVELAIPSIPFVWKTGGTYVVPGHGRIYNQADVISYRDMVVIIRDRVRDMLNRGMSLAQVQAASPAQGFVGAFGTTEGEWTTSRFIEAVYRTSTRRTR